MAATQQSVSQTLEDIISWRPVLEPILRSFEPVFIAQEKLTTALQEPVLAAGVRVPEVKPEPMAHGLSLLAEYDFAGAAPFVRKSAAKLLPLLAALEPVKAHAAALARLFQRKSRKGEQWCERLLAALVQDDKAALEKLAEEAHIDPQVLVFVGGFVVAPVLRAMVRQVPLTENGLAPWEQGATAWHQGYCPVCGSMPSIGWFDRPHVDKKNPYLVGGGGKKHLHCGMCGAEWGFLRGTCPSCGAQESGDMELLRESGPNHGERIDFCNKCKGYCPTVDLREREFIPHFDTLALGMMHLDMVAARKKLRPLKMTFWNVF